MLSVLFVMLLYSPFLVFEKANLSQDETTVRWNERKLDWLDFQGTIPVNPQYLATTHSSIRGPGKTKGDTLFCEVYAEFDKLKSWVVKGKESVSLLNHEQRHFDITEYSTRCYRHDLFNHKFESISTVKDEISSIMSSNHKKLIALEKEYDRETNHSINKEAQIKWDKKIDSLLQTMSDYADPKVNVYIGYLYKK